MEEKKSSAYLQNFIAFWTLVIIQFLFAIGTIFSEDIPRNILQFTTFIWGVLIGILAEKGGLHPFNYRQK